MKHCIIIVGLITFCNFLQACMIKITPEKTSGNLNEELKVTISVRNQHIPCPLAINSTEIAIDGGSIINQTDWTKKSATEYEKSITVKLTATPKTIINVKRACDIKTSQATAQIDVKNNISTDFKTLTQTIKETTTTVLNKLGQLYLLRSNLQTLNQLEKDPKLKKQISNLIGELDSILKSSRKLATRCSLLLKGL
ncbi:MAG: hypothetical protein NZ601_05135 [candidate division WOR-3 bacterium]|nr:hypothetical protein [candidate division WOR-3 bacterium]MDW7987250.1 hypothetical protein [candidate division WOR-3 bacterium]